MCPPWTCPTLYLCSPWAVPELFLGSPWALPDKSSLALPRYLITLRLSELVMNRKIYVMATAIDPS